MKKCGPSTTDGFKGLPVPAGMPVTSIGDLGWNALLDLEYPALVLHEDQLAHNITTMADYCRDHRVELAPHAKTSLSPQLIRRQMEAGAWGATAATAAQVRGLLAIGVPRNSARESARRYCGDPLDRDACARCGGHSSAMSTVWRRSSCWIGVVRPGRSRRADGRALGGGIRRRSHRCEKPRGGPRRGAGG
jgi:hypothetical protein